MQKSPEFNRFYLYSLVFNAALGSFYFGYIIGVLNPLEFYLAYDVYHWPEEKINFYIGLIGAMVPLGAIPGAFFAGKFASSYGRRKSFIISDVIAFGGLICSIFAELPIMLVGRFISGFCVGLNSVLVPLYINEVSPISVKGIMGSMNQIFICLGILIAYAMGYELPYPFIGYNIPANNIWRIIFFFPSIALFLRLSFSLTVFNYDTPKFLILMRQDDEAQKILGLIYANNPSGAREHMQMLIKERDITSVVALGYSDMFNNKYRKRTIIGMLLGVLQQFSGINALITYSTTIFLGDINKEDSQFPSIEEFNKARNLTTLVGGLNFVAPIIGSILIYSFGRKDLLIFGLALLIICWLTVVIFLVGVPAEIAILVYIFAFGISLGPIAWIYVAEILPDIGISLAALVNWVSAVIIIQTFPLVQDFTSARVSFSVFLFSCIFGILFVSVFIKETKDKTNAQIIEMFSSEHLAISREEKSENDEEIG